MRLKSFHASTMKEAMQMVRDTLGEDAVIVATRDEKRGGGVRVTAAIDPSDYSERNYGGPSFETHGREAPSSAETWLQYDDEDEEAAVAEEITDAMLRHAVPEDVMDQILSCATVIGFEEPGIALIAAIEHLFHFTPLPRERHDKAIMMVGAPGSGKTLAAAKMAARGAMEGLKVGVISTDTVRAGGIEQLESFTNLLKIGLHRAESPQQLAEKIEALRACDQIIVDTSGTNPFDPEEVKKLAKLIGAAQCDPCLVLPGGIDAEESGEMARVFASVGVETLIPARVDIARRLGGILSAAHHGSMGFADAGNTPKVADGLVSLNPKKLSKLLMPAAYRDNKAKATNTARSKKRTGTYQ